MEKVELGFVSACMYLQGHSRVCMNRQSEERGRGLREELCWQILVGMAQRLDGRECPLQSGRQVWGEAGMHE